jgi:branched-chain amino acid transport system permease protein
MVDRPQSATKTPGTPGVGGAPVEAPARRRPAELAALVLFVLLALLPVLAVVLRDPFILVIATRIMIFAIAAISLDIILGYGGLVSFGHAAFMGIGAYAVGILARHGFSDLLAQLLVAVLASAAFGLITGAIALRTRGVYFIMITLAFGQMAYFLMVSLSAYGGDDGLTLYGRSTILGMSWLHDDFVFFYLVLAFFTAVFLASQRIIGSRFGRVLRGTRDNPMRMQAIGFAPFGYQLTAYVIAGCIAGIAGVLLANQAEFVSPAYMAWQRSGDLIIMIILGGMGSLTGAVIGAAAFTLLEEWLAALSQHWKFALGAILVLAVLYTRGGLVGLAQRLMPRGQHA